MTTACFYAHKNGVNQTGIVSATPTLVTWPTEGYDIGSYFASDLWIPPGGNVFLSAHVFYTGTQTAGVSTGKIYIYKNGVVYASRAHRGYANASMGIIELMDACTGTDTYGVWGEMVLASGTGTFDGQQILTGFYGHWIPS